MESFRLKAEDCQGESKRPRRGARDEGWEENVHNGGEAMAGLINASLLPFFLQLF